MGGGLKLRSRWRLGFGAFATAESGAGYGAGSLAVLDRLLRLLPGSQTTPESTKALLVGLL